jgi:hypothetical protein
MTRLILIATVFMLASGPVPASGKTYGEYLAMTCGQFTQLYAGSGFAWNDGYPRWEDDNFANAMYYVLGYLTYAANNVVSEGHHVNNPRRQSVNPIAWIGSWCRNHPSDLLTKSVDAYIEK